MLQTPVMAETPDLYLAAHGADLPVHFFSPAALSARLSAFLTGFPGLVTYAVKANPADHVIAQLSAGGVTAFDVASPDEIALIRRLAPGAALHYNNPVRSRAEIAGALAAGVASWAVDDAGELDKLIAAGLPRTAEIAVRFRLPVKGAVYDFGAKFGADPEEAARLLARVAAEGHVPALTFHVGTQCPDPSAWDRYIREAAAIARAAGVTIGRLNVGGGFPAARDGRPVDLTPFFTAIDRAADAFDRRPALVCEPGRGMVADAFAYAVPVKSLRAGRVYLQDGIYGGLSEFTSMTVPAFRVLSADGTPRSGAPVPRTVFGPTCDSLDRLPQDLALPADTEEGDVLLFPSTGAYLTGVTTRFNGYGLWRTVTVGTL